MFLPYCKLQVHDISDIQNDVFSLIPKSLFQRPRFYNPESHEPFLKIPGIIKLFKYYGLPIKNANFFPHVVAPYATSPIHIDSGTRRYSLNIPIKNCKNTFTTFYSSSREPILVPARVINGVSHLPHYKIEENSCTPICRIDTTETYIIDTSVPHNTENKNGIFRVNLLIRCEDETRIADILSGK